MKKYLLGLFAIVLAVGFSSFKAAKTFSSTWIAVQSTSQIAPPLAIADGDLDFSTFQTATPAGCGGTAHYCYAQFDNTKLNFDANNEPISLKTSPSVPDSRVTRP